MADPPSEVDFMEVAPENWIHVGGALGKKFRWFTERYPFVIHGLSLSIGGPAPLDEQLVRDIKAFMADHGIRMYSEHLSYCGDDGQLYDLMPIPFTEEAVSYVAARVRRVQDILEQRIALENVSYYAPTDTSMSEADFVNAVLEEADVVYVASSTPPDRFVSISVSVGSRAPAHAVSSGRGRFESPFSK